MSASFKVLGYNPHDDAYLLSSDKLRQQGVSSHLWAQCATRLEVGTTVNGLLTPIPKKLQKKGMFPVFKRTIAPTSLPEPAAEAAEIPEPINPDLAFE